MSSTTAQRRSGPATILQPLTIPALLLSFLGPTTASAQSCVLTRLDSPVLQAFDNEFGTGADLLRWQFSFGYRYGYSFRHFVGTDEQEHRLAEHSQVVNNVNLADLSLRFNFGPRTSLTVGVPYIQANRDSGLRDDSGEVVRRYTRSETSGIGDITLVAKRLVWDPSSHPRSNLSLGLGVKVPTGDDTQNQTRLSMDGGEVVSSTSTADFSVQPGDGSWGAVVEASGFAILDQRGTLAFYGSGVYVLEPDTTNGVERPGAREGEEYVSASDQYVARLGLQLGPHAWKGVTVGLGGRIEGVPVRDLIGSSYGRRRPGYMISVEPSVSWSRRGQSISLAVPYAVERNRQRSVADLARGAHGDAAFPDYLVLASYSVKF